MIAGFADMLASEAAPDPQLVVDAYLALADAAPGKRPTRTVVGITWGSSCVTNHGLPRQHAPGGMPALQGRRVRAALTGAARSRGGRPGRVRCGRRSTDGQRSISMAGGARCGSVSWISPSVRGRPSLAGVKLSAPVFSVGSDIGRFAERRSPGSKKFPDPRGCTGVHRPKAIARLHARQETRHAHRGWRNERMGRAAPRDPRASRAGRTPRSARGWRGRPPVGPPPAPPRRMRAARSRRRPPRRQSAGPPCCRPSTSGNYPGRRRDLTRRTRRIAGLWNLWARSAFDGFRPVPSIKG